MARDAVVIGGGPAGLTTAYQGQKLGIAPTVLEADAIVGGISRTVSYKGYRFDIGGHRFFSKVQQVNELWDEILGEAFLMRPRMSRIHYKGIFFDYPLKAANTLQNLGLVESALCGFSYAKARLFPQMPEVTFEEWVSNRFGKRLFNIFFRTYTEKVWGIKCSEISADWAAQRIKNLSLSEAVRSALLGAGGKTKNNEVITTLIDKFKYPEFGPGQMWERCEQLVADRGGQTIKGVMIDRVHVKDGRAYKATGRGRHGEPVEFGAEHFISSMPLRELVRCLSPQAPTEVLRAADKLRYRDFLTVVLIVQRENLFPDNWIYIHTPEVKVGRVQNFGNWSPAMVPDAGRSSLGLEYFLWDKDDMWNWPDEKLIELGTKECIQIGLINPGDVLDGCVVRQPKAYPVYDQHYKQAVDTIRGYLDTIPNLQTVGRNGQHRYNNQDHSMMTGVLAARNMAGENLDIWEVNVEKAYHEEVRKGEAKASMLKPGDARPADVKPAPTGDRLVPRPVKPGSREAILREVDALITRSFSTYDPVALGVACGLIASIMLAVVSGVALAGGSERLQAAVGLLQHLVPGFGLSLPGLLLGMLSLFVMMFAAGAGVALLHRFAMMAHLWLLKRSVLRTLELEAAEST